MMGVDWWLGGCWKVRGAVERRRVIEFYHRRKRENVIKLLQ
jgi:hypothetical protein